jgi:hypothetical protein
MTQDSVPRFIGHEFSVCKAAAGKGSWKGQKRWMAANNKGKEEECRCLVKGTGKKEWKMNKVKPGTGKGKPGERRANPVLCG